MKKIKSYLSPILICLILVSIMGACKNSDTVLSKDETSPNDVNNTDISKSKLRQEMSDCYNTLGEMYRANRSIFTHVTDIINKAPDTELAIYYNSESKTINDIYYNDSYYSFQDYFTEAEQKSVKSCFEIMAFVAPKDCNLSISKRALLGEYKIVEFVFRIPELSVDFGIMFTDSESTQEPYGNSEKIDDNWYVFELWGV